MKPKVSIPKKIITALVAVVLLSAGCGGGGSGQSKQVILNFWDPFENTEDLQPLFAAFQQKYPGVQVVYTKKDIFTYNNDLLDALATGNGPDIFSINNSWVPVYVDKTAPATSTFFSYKDYKDAFIDVAVNDFTVNQKVYGVPLHADSLALYYNKDILGSAGIATPPKTWQELQQDVQIIKRADKTGYFTLSGLAAGTNSNVNRAVDILYLTMLQKGLMPYSKDGTRPQFDQNIQINGNNDYPGLDGLQFYTSFADPRTPNYNWNSRSDYSIDAFANGRAAFLYSYSYTAATIRQKNPNLNFDVAEAPQPNLDSPSVNFANYWGEVVSKQSKNQTAAWALLKFITSKASLDKFYSKNKQPSSRKDLISLQIQDPDIGVFANANLTAKSFYRPDQQVIDNIFGNMIDSVILKGLDAKTALSQGQIEASALKR